MNATIKPINGQVALVEMGGQNRSIEMDQVAEMVNALVKGGIEVEVSLFHAGFRIPAWVVDELAEVAGLTSYQSAKALASGKMMFT